MITNNELSKKARQKNIPFGTIEKDYFLTMLLEGISQNDRLKQNFIFKGGTALRKAYFKNYRYSEDIDFTLIKHLDKKEIEIEMKKVFGCMKKKHNVDYRIKSIHQNKGFIDLKIQFYGLRGGKNTITLDLMSEEVILLQTKEMKIINEYYNDRFKLKVYSLEEILAEKLRGLLQRTRVRDYYDTWYLLTKTKVNVNKTEEILLKKMEFKKISFNNKQFLEQAKIEKARQYYKKQLSHQ